ncbi:hypothetical protein LV779_23685 [Streptomyces thinghirensis]|nr:hypothetical protein [Streptomyces thinghirensis]
MPPRPPLSLRPRILPPLPSSTGRSSREREEREINRIIDERMASPAAGVPIEDVMRETLARGE